MLINRGCCHFCHDKSTEKVNELKSAENYRKAVKLYYLDMEKAKKVKVKVEDEVIKMK